MTRIDFLEIDRYADMGDGPSQRMACTAEKTKMNYWMPRVTSAAENTRIASPKQDE